MEKLRDGTLLLAASNSYTGPTLVSAGTLRVNGQIGSGGVTVAAGFFGGTGTIKGPVTVQSDGTLAPGNSIGTLAISNALTLQPGSTTHIEVNVSTSVRDPVQGLSSVSYGGNMVVSNLAGTSTQQGHPPRPARKRRFATRPQAIRHSQSQA
jgi:autotransporter-associated beta strand protein